MVSVDRGGKHPRSNQLEEKRVGSATESSLPGPAQEQPAFLVYTALPMPASAGEPARDAGYGRPERRPMVIRGTRDAQEESRRAVSPAAGRKPIVHGAVSALLLFVTVGALLSILPVGTDARDVNPWQPVIHLISSRSNATALIEAQAATATAVTVDGYDPGGHETYAGVQSAPSGLSGSFSVADIGNLGRFFYGQCTYWSNMRYRQLTGHWVPWLGNAYQWAYAAPAYGWTISARPNPNGPSIIVLAPYVQGSGRFGHVAVVEHVASSSSNGVLTSNWNWSGHWATLDWVRFYPGPGVSFLWYPG